MPNILSSPILPVECRHPDSFIGIACFQHLIQHIVCAAAVSQGGHVPRFKHFLPIFALRILIPFVAQSKKPIRNEEGIVGRGVEKLR